MANVQLENGYCSIATDLITKLCSYRLSGEEWQVLLVVWRKTYCWHKKEDLISLSQFALLTEMKRPSVVRAIKKLVTKKLLSVTQKANSSIKLYRFNKDFDKWIVLPKQLPRGIVLVTKQLTGGNQTANEVVTKQLHTKDTLTKDTLTKDKIQQTSFAGNEQQVFNILYKINPTIRFGSLTERGAVTRLFEKLGVEKTVRLAEFAVKVFGEKFAPVITTPLELERNAAKLVSYWTKNNKTNVISV